ncbi:MAG: alpha/beta fold hydrolase [Herbiconiux sp.]|nr:alpha/beta fold hydrolase [Herbiconiux sp.]
MTVLLLHGLGGSRANSLAMFSPILPPGERVIALDVRAHGDDPRLGEPADLTLPALAADVTAQVRAAFSRDAALDEPLTVIGISMGAAIALRLALDDSLPLARVVFVRPAFTDVPLPDNLAGFPVIGELLADHGAVEGEREFLRTDLYGAVRAESPRAAEGLLEQFRAPSAAERSRRLIEIPRSPAFTDAESPASIRVPTAIVWAPRDPVHPVSVAELWMDELDGAASIPLPARDDDYAAYVAATRRGTAAWLGWD